MEVKEAIEKIESIYDCHENDRACSKEDREDIQKEKEQIKELLQEGEKYKEIFKEITINGYFSIIDKKYLKQLEQKYFPKEEKSDGS